MNGFPGDPAGTKQVAKADRAWRREHTRVMQTADAAKSEHDAVGERTNLIVRGLPAGITEAILFQALQHNPSIQSIRIVPNSKNDSSARTGVVRLLDH